MPTGVAGVVLVGVGEGWSLPVFGGSLRGVIVIFVTVPMLFVLSILSVPMGRYLPVLIAWNEIGALSVDGGIQFCPVSLGTLSVVKDRIPRNR